MISFASDLGFVLYSTKDCTEHFGTGHMGEMDGNVNGLQFLSGCSVLLWIQKKLYAYNTDSSSTELTSLIVVSNNFQGCQNYPEDVSYRIIIISPAMSFPAGLNISVKLTC